MSPQLLDRNATALVVIDVQEAFREGVHDFDAVAANTSALVQGARIIGLDILVTEQYPRGLGETVAEVSEHLDGVPRHAKVVFSAAQADGFEIGQARQALVCGLESHVCVAQTVHDLLGQGIEVHVVADAVSSRTSANREIGLHKMERAGAQITSTETALFELLRRAGTDEFKQIQKLVL